MAEFNFDLKKLLNDRRFRIFGGCAVGLIALAVLIAAATPKSVNITNYINNGNSCKIARKIKLKPKRSKKS